MERKILPKEIEILRNWIETDLRYSMSDDYTDQITDKILDYVVEDLEFCADDEYNQDDIKLAIGRAILHYIND